VPTALAQTVSLKVVLNVHQACALADYS
jgi:hypothetical protein